MNRALLILSLFMLIVVASASQMSAQIHDIKKQAEENQKKKEEKEKTPVKKPVSPGKEETPIIIPVVPVVEDFQFLPVHSEVESPESYSDDYETIELGCLIPAFITEGSKPDVDFLHNIDSSFWSLELRNYFDIGYHPSPSWHLMYVDFLPGIRANLEYFMLDFRFNILTEYTDDYPDSFKSWELLLLFNLVPQRKFKLFIGMGIHKEEFTDSKCNEHLIGSKVNFNNSNDFIDADFRFSVDYKTRVFPFFECGCRYNKRLFVQKKVVVHLALGPIYQNYYQSHDIWSIRGGVIINLQ